MTLVSATHITASVFINDGEVWLEELALHAPTSPYQHNRTDEDACPYVRDR